MKQLMLAIWSSIQSAFDGAESFMDDHIENVIAFMKSVKLVIESPIMDGVVIITPTDIDNQLLPGLRILLARAIDVLEIQQECSSCSTDEEKIACYCRYVQNLSPEMRDAILHKTASIMSRLGLNNKFTNSELDTLVQIGFIKNKQ